MDRLWAAVPGLVRHVVTACDSIWTIAGGALWHQLRRIAQTAPLRPSAWDWFSRSVEKLLSERKPGDPFTTVVR